MLLLLLRLLLLLLNLLLLNSQHAGEGILSMGRVRVPHASVGGAMDAASSLWAAVATTLGVAVAFATTAALEAHGHVAGEWNRE